MTESGLILASFVLAVIPALWAAVRIGWVLLRNARPESQPLSSRAASRAK